MWQRLRQRVPLRAAAPAAPGSGKSAKQRLKAWRAGHPAHLLPHGVPHVSALTPGASVRRARAPVAAPLRSRTAPRARPPLASNEGAKGSTLRTDQSKSAQCTPGETGSHGHSCRLSPVSYRCNTKQIHRLQYSHVTTSQRRSQPALFACALGTPSRRHIRRPSSADCVQGTLIANSHGFT